jgi:hypothetical protein
MGRSGVAKTAKGAEENQRPSIHRFSGERPASGPIMNLFIEAAFCMSRNFPTLRACHLRERSVLAKRKYTPGLPRNCDTVTDTANNTFCIISTVAMFRACIRRDVAESLDLRFCNVREEFVWKQLEYSFQPSCKQDAEQQQRSMRSSDELEDAIPAHLELCQTYLLKAKLALQH